MKTEHQEQRMLIQWFRRRYPARRIFAIPNGGQRNKATAMNLKIEGVVSGVPDLFVPEWSLWVEMKREKGGRLSPTQKDWLEYLAGIGHKCIVGHGFEDAKEKILLLFDNRG
tara:strand:- start:2114 stop:2449 length:336 start_codon:yes stop_codon:yes gene_type:complete